MSERRKIEVRVSQGRHDEVRAMLDAHPDWIHSLGGWSLMTGAGLRRDIEMMDLLYERGLDANALGTNPEYPPLAACCDAPEVVRWLLDHGADASRPGVMVGAATLADADTIRLLLSRGGDVVSRTGEPPRNAVEQALAMRRSPEVVELLQPPDGAFDTFGWLRRAIGPMRLVPTPTDAPCRLLLGQPGPHRTLVTFGLSEHPLPGLGHRAEVMMRLPPDVPMTAALADDAMWPVDWILSVATAGLRGPLLAPPHTLAHAAPPGSPSADLPFVGALLVDERHDTTRPDGTPVKLLSVVLLHPDELTLARRDPMALITALHTGDVSEAPIVDPTRRCVVPAG